MRQMYNIKRLNQLDVKVQLPRIYSDHEEIICRECLDRYDENQCQECGEIDENCECMECPECSNLITANASECEMCRDHDPEMSETDYAWDFDGRGDFEGRI